MASGDKFYIADKTTLDGVDEKIGSTVDTGGSSTAGSVFGKLNYLVSQVASYLVSIYNNCLKIGSTADTGGTIAEGTIMGKINSLIASSGKKSFKRSRQWVQSPKTQYKVLSILGSGEFYSAYCAVSSISIIVDGVTYTVNNGNSDYLVYMEGVSGTNETDGVCKYTIAQQGDATFPIPFKNSLEVLVSTYNTTSTWVVTAYSLYE